MSGSSPSDEDYEFHKGQPYFKDGSAWKNMVLTEPFAQAPRKSFYRSTTPYPAKTPTQSSSVCVFMDFTVKQERRSDFEKELAAWAATARQSSCEGFSYGQSDNCTTEAATVFHVFQRYPEGAVTTAPAAWEKFVATSPFVCKPTVMKFQGNSV